MAGDGAKKLKPMSMTRSANLILGVCVALASQAFSADSEILISKPPMRWLWGGFGFHNSEATMTGLMSEDFLNQRVLKTFLEISPTYARVFAGYLPGSSLVAKRTRMGDGIPFSEHGVGAGSRVLATTGDIQHEQSECGGGIGRGGCGGRSFRSRFFGADVGQHVPD